MAREYSVSSESLSRWTDFIIESFEFFELNRIQDLIFSDRTPKQVVREILNEERLGSEKPILPEGSVENNDLMKVPLTGKRYVLIPKDFTQKEMDYFTGWFKMWNDLHNESGN